MANKPCIPPAELTSKNYLHNLANGFLKLQRDGTCTDVELCFDGDCRAKCHRLILAAASPLFETILIENQLEENLTIAVHTDIKGKEMLAILQFLYSGSVSFPNGGYSEFMLAAKFLRIRGLSDEMMMDANGNDLYTDLVYAIKSKGNVPKPDIPPESVELSLPSAVLSNRPKSTAMKATNSYTVKPWRRSRLEKIRQLNGVGLQQSDIALRGLRKKVGRKSYGEYDMYKALLAIINCGKTINDAAKAAQIPYTTLRSWAKYFNIKYTSYKRYRKL